MMHRRLTGGGTVVGGIKAGTFEHDAHRLVNLVERLLSAFWTFCKRVISKMLENIKLMTAGFTSISIRRHISLLYSKKKNKQSLYEILIIITIFKLSLDEKKGEGYKYQVVRDLPS